MSIRARRPARARLVAVLAAALVVGMPAAAIAAPADVATEGSWYYDLFKVQAAQDAGYTGEGVTIGLIDGQLYPDAPTLADADIQFDDGVYCYVDGKPMPPTVDDFTGAHGLSTASVIVGSGAGYDGQQGVKGVAPDATIRYFAVNYGGVDNESCDRKDGGNAGYSVEEAINAAVDAGVDIISMSIVAEGGPEANAAVLRALAAGIPVIFGVSNQDGSTNVPSDLQMVGINGVVGVQAIDRNAQIQTHTDLSGESGLLNTDPNTDVAGPGIGILTQGSPDSWSDLVLRSGTSLATPIVAGFLAVVSQKYPEATGNQLLQTLILNTGDGAHELSYDTSQQIGYGIASLTSMLQDDPTQYPDVNPLLSADGVPSPADVAAAVEAATASPTPEPTEPPTTSGFGSRVALIVGIVLVAVLLVTGIIIALVVRRRRRQTGS